MTEARTLSAEAARALREGRAAEAANLFAQLTRVQPDDANHWFNLGWSLRASRQYEAALEAYAEALKRGVTQPEDVHVNRSVILSEYLHRPAEAVAELRRAVAANPEAVPAWLNLGSLCEDLGDGTGARAAYRSALEADPGSGRALARLAAIDVHEGRGAEAIDMLRGAAQRPFRQAQDAAEVFFALGSALDATGDYSAAFQAVSEGNRVGSVTRPAALQYDPGAQERLVDSLIAMPPLENAGVYPANRSPIFICGMFRSGSTLAEQLLARHPQITAGGELEFIPAMVREDLQPYPTALAEVESGRLRELRDKYLEQLQRLYPDSTRVTDKRPDNFLHLGLIKALFPEARIVHTVRQALDNILSVYFLYFADSVTYSGSLDEITHFYAQYRRLMKHWDALYDTGIHDVSYDQLVASPRTELEKLLSFLGLEWDEACLDHRSGGAVRTASNWQVRKPVHQRSSGRWRNYAKELKPLRQRLSAAGLLDD